jgi:hypothetical protein
VKLKKEAVCFLLEPSNTHFWRLQHHDNTRSCCHCSCCLLVQQQVVKLIRRTTMASIDPRPLKKGRRTATPDDFEPLGGEIMGRSTGRSASVFEARWINFFGVICVVVADVWNHLIAKNEPELKSAAPVHLLWALLFLKQYPTESVFCKLVGVQDEGTVRYWSQLIVRHVGYLVPDVVRSHASSCRLLLHCFIISFS